MATSESKEGTYRRILQRRSAYGFESGLTDQEMAGQLTNDFGAAENWAYNPLELQKIDAGKDGYPRWATEYGRQLQAVRNARKQPWAQRLVDKRVSQKSGATDPELRWFLPLEDRPAEVTADDLADIPI